MKNRHSPHKNLFQGNLNNHSRKNIFKISLKMGVSAPKLYLARPVALMFYAGPHDFEM